MAEYVGRDAVIVGAVRTPIGKGKAGGALHDVLPVDLLAHSLKELINREAEAAEAAAAGGFIAPSPGAAAQV